MLGVRAILPCNRAHSLAEDGVTRLCYAGSTLQSTPQSVEVGGHPSSWALSLRQQFH